MKNNILYLTALALSCVLNEDSHASLVDEGGVSALTLCDDLLKRNDIPHDAPVPHKWSCIEKNKIQDISETTSEMKSAEDAEVLGPVCAHKLTATHKFEADKFFLSNLGACTCIRIPSSIHGRIRNNLNDNMSGREKNALVCEDDRAYVVIPAALAENEPDTVKNVITFIRDPKTSEIFKLPTIYGYDGVPHSLGSGILVLCKIIREDGGSFFHTYHDHYVRLIKEKLNRLEKLVGREISQDIEILKEKLENIEELEKVGIFEIDWDEYQKLLEIREAADKAEGYVFIPYALIKQDGRYEIILRKEPKRRP